jgi:Fe2+ transport system protein FeoA
VEARHFHPTTELRSAVAVGSTFVICPLCGFEFEPGDTACAHGCPLRTACGLIRCPGCDYEFPETPRAVSWLRRLFGRGEASAGSGELLTVCDLARGERAEVVHLSTTSAGRSNALAVFGLVPGSEIVLLQRLPSYVLQVGETVLALEEAVAASIVVRRPTDGGPPPSALAPAAEALALLEP